MEPRGTTGQIIETAYAVHGGSLLRRLSARTRDHAAGEDLMHEAFLRLWLEVEAGRAPAEIGAWLFRVGANLANSRERRLAVAGRHRTEVSFGGEAPSPEVLAVRAEQVRWVRDALAQMNARDREVLILSATGHRGPEIARRIGRTEAATRVMLHRARTKLRARVIEAAVS